MNYLFVTTGWDFDDESEWVTELMEESEAANLSLAFDTDTFPAEAVCFFRLHQGSEPVRFDPSLSRWLTEEESYKEWLLEYAAIPWDSDSDLEDIPF